MKRHIAALAACVGALVFAPFVHSGTPNTTAAGAVSYEVGNGWVTDGVDESSQNRWFAYLELAGRSYCVEATLGPATYFPLDPNLTLYSDSAGTTVFLSNSDGAGEPTQYRGSRVCYQSPLGVGANFVRLVKVNVPVTAGSGDSGFVRVRVVDTTLIFPFVWLKNDSTGVGSKLIHIYVTTTQSVDVNGSFYVPGYGIVKTFTGNSRFQAPNQSTGKGFSEFVFGPGNSIANWSWQGVGYLMNDGPPGALEAWLDTTDFGGATVRLYANSRMAP